VLADADPAYKAELLSALGVRIDWFPSSDRARVTLTDRACVRNRVGKATLDSPSGVRMSGQIRKLLRPEEVAAGGARIADGEPLAALRRRAGALTQDGRVGGVGRSAGEGGDLDRVVPEHAPAAPGAGAGEAAEAGAVPAVLTFQGGDSAFGAGAPFDECDEVIGRFDRSAGLAGLALSEDGDKVDTEFGEVVIERCLAVAAIGGDRRGARHRPRRWPARWRARAGARRVACRAQSRSPRRCPDGCR